MGQKNVSLQTLRRLPVYLHYLRTIQDQCVNISATAIADKLGLNDVQVRKDLASVSGSGRPKTGYNTLELLKQLETYLGCGSSSTTVLIGAGKLGQALLGYSGFDAYGLNILAAFDVVPNAEATASGKPIYSMEKLEHFCKINKVRMGIIESTHGAKAGHPGGSLSATEMFTYLYFKEMNIDPANPKWEDRDRFVLSKGHTAPGLYSVLANRGFFPVEDLPTLRHIDSYLQGHPNMNTVPGVDMSTGSLGQGISTACGMALAAKIQGKSNRVYTLLGDGEIQEGQVWEACMAAAHYKLDNFVAIVDNNGLQIDGDIAKVMSPYPIVDKLQAFGFHVQTIDAHDFDQIEAALNTARTVKGQPTAIVMKSIKGKGVSYMENKCEWHGAAPKEEQYVIAINELNKILKCFLM